MPTRGRVGWAIVCLLQKPRFLLANWVNKIGLRNFRVSGGLIQLRRGYYAGGANGTRSFRRRPQIVRDMVTPAGRLILASHMKPPRDKPAMSLLSSPPLSPRHEVFHVDRILVPELDLPPRKHKIIAVLPAFNAERTLAATLADVPVGCVDDFLL